MQALAVSAPQDLIKVLTNEATENYLGSVTLLKQLTVAAVSTVVYFKDAFPEDSYNIEKFRELKLRILKMKCRDESAQFLSTALINAFDAFDKKYLHRLALCFYDDECRPENLVDYHIFEYTYHEAGASLRVRSGRGNGGPERRGLDDKAYAMLQSCTIINNGFQKKLPASFDISLRLYYNEAAPEDYQAPGFHCGDEFEEHLSQVDMSTYLLGEVETPYHGFRVTSCFKENLGSSHEAIASQNPPLMTQTQDVPVTSSLAGYAVSEGAVRCPCGLDRADLPRDVTSLITCDYCKTQQHAACFGLLRGGGGGGGGGGVGGGHCCARCADAEAARRPTCPRLAKLDNKKRESQCAVRLMLAWCGARGAVSSAPLCALGLAQRYVLRLLQYLRAKHVLAHDDWNVPQKVNEPRLREVMASFFSDLKPGVVERLLEETLASQESRSDSAPEVLSPSQMASLREATSVGRVVELHSPVPAGELLQQYRDALTPTLKDESLADTLAGFGLARNKRKLEPDTTTLRSKVKSKRCRSTFE
ncbi:HORMA domain-containing protein 1 [Papilio xuthus]|uniref:HORMA domain-containing protein 1 n=1 Tax=Papilio xuthus TaxID=66420 RepID=A0A194Q7S3_PAPXU|nr:HORMA domain-containing protein 1 [Papilio xuthus]